MSKVVIENLLKKNIDRQTMISNGFKAQKYDDVLRGHSSYRLEDIIEISERFQLSLDYLVYGCEKSAPLTTEEQECINKFNLLTDIDKGRILDRMETMHNAYSAGKSKAIFIAARNGNDEKTISERREKGIVNPEILDNIPTMSEE